MKVPWANVFLQLVAILPPLLDFLRTRSLDAKKKVDDYMVQSYMGWKNEDNSSIFNDPRPGPPTQ